MNKSQSERIINQDNQRVLHRIIMYQIKIENQLLHQTSSTIKRALYYQYATDNSVKSIICRSMEKE